MGFMKIVYENKRTKRRAVELYARNTPFRPKVVELKTAYSRKIKHRNLEI